MSKHSSPNPPQTSAQNAGSQNPVLNEAALEAFQKEQEAASRKADADPTQLSGLAPMPNGYGALSAESLEALAGSSPAGLDQALKLLQLKERIKILRLEEDERASKAKLTAQMVREVFKQQQEDKAMKDACERSGHRRENGTQALGAQHDSYGKLISICVRCHRVYHGVGNGPDELPSHFLSALQNETIGG